MHDGLLTIIVLSFELCTVYRYSLQYAVIILSRVCVCVVRRRPVADTNGITSYIFHHDDITRRSQPNLRFETKRINNYLSLLLLTCTFLLAASRSIVRLLFIIVWSEATGRNEWNVPMLDARKRNNASSKPIHSDSTSHGCSRSYRW